MDKPCSPGSHRRSEIAAWCLYDFANSAFTTLVVTFIYATFFAASMAENDVQGTVLWSRGITVSAMVVALLSPIAGAIADQGGYRKRMLMGFMLTSVVCTAWLYRFEPGDALPALVCFVIANIAFELGNVFYNAMLPTVAPPKSLGRVSGYGWALGYLGGLSALALALVGFVQTDAPWFGFSQIQQEHIRATNLLVAAWFGLFSLPLFVFYRERQKRLPLSKKLCYQSLVQLRATFSEIRKYRQVMRFLLARLLYNDGLITVFAFGGIFAKVVFDFSFTEILVFGIALNVAAGIGALGMGFLDDALGGKPTILISLVGLISSSLLAIAAPDRFWFWVAGMGIGVFAGPNQAASRSLMARFVPQGKQNEFFGFYALSGKAMAFVGPFLLGTVTQLFDSVRAGVSVVLFLFISGGAILLFVSPPARQE